MIMIIHGPPGCGKTRNGPGLAEKYGCKHVLDFDEFIKLRLHQQVDMTNAGALLLTADEAEARHHFPGAKFIPFNETSEV